MQIVDHKIHNDFLANSISVSDLLSVPSYHPPSLSSPTTAGSLIYDPQIQSMFYSNGLAWIPLGGSTVVGASYSFIKQNIQSIPSLTTTQLGNWTISPSSVYSTLPEWDLVTGTFTAIAACILTMDADISWAPGNNLGNRTVQIEFQAFGSGIWVPIKKTVTQPDPNIAVVTTQELSTVARLAVGDKIRIAAIQSSLNPAIVDIGIETSVSGIKLSL